MTSPAFQAFHRLCSAAYGDTDHELQGLSVPYAGQTRMRLTITSGMADARIRIDPEASDLIAIEHGGDFPPSLRVSSSELRLSFPGWFWASLFAAIAGEERDLEIVLHPAVEWTVQLRGGLSHVEADLAAGKLARLEIVGGVSDVRFALPAPVGIVPIRISGGASELSMRRPADTGVALVVSGGISRLRLDEQAFDAVGGGARLITGPVHGDLPRYAFEIGGGVSGLEIAAH